jgi:hypothetical protein
MILREKQAHVLPASATSEPEIMSHWDFFQKKLRRYYFSEIMTLNELILMIFELTTSKLRLEACQ